MADLTAVEVPPCEPSGTGRGLVLTCGHRSPTYRNRIAALAGLRPEYEPVQCSAGNWHHQRKESA